jgi:predicted acylesterase/phospholipase RssA
VLAGTSVGAMNAVAWLAHDFRTGALERVWRELTPPRIGIHWITLALHAGGLTVMALGAIQVALTLLGSPELGLGARLWGAAPRSQALSALLDAAAWATVAVAGVAMARLARPAEGWLAALSGPRDPNRAMRWFERALVAGALVHLAAWALAIPWPHRFSASVLALASALWGLNRWSRGALGLRRLLVWLLPETRGRGLWAGVARRRLIAAMVESGDPARLTRPDVRLILGALALDTGRIVHFVTGPADEAWREALGATDEWVPLADASEVIAATMASSAIPLAFEPVEIGGRAFVDAGQFSNQPLAAARAAGADALLVVLMTPSAGPPPAAAHANLVDVAGRLVVLASWRQLQAELSELPADLGLGPAGAERLVVVEPEGSLPATLMDFRPAVAAELVRRGEVDAWRALERAGWLAPA